MRNPRDCLLYTSFTEDDRNIQFSVDSGYLPVTKTANNIKKIKSKIKSDSATTMSIISTAIDTVNTNTLYTTKAFKNGTSARNILEYAMSDKASEDRAKVVENLKNLSLIHI